jgi:voltage-gated potassium channel Kch
MSMSVAGLAAPVFAFTALGSKTVGHIKLFEQTWPIHEEYIDNKHPWHGRQLDDLWENRSRMLIYYLPVDGDMDLVSAVLDRRRLRAGDRIIIGTKPKIRSGRRSIIAKFLKIITNIQRFQEHASPLIAMTIAFIAIVTFATLVYTYNGTNVSIVDALYFAVGMITGAGGNDRVVENASISIKLFTVIMMLVGAGVIGLLYALLNDFVLGTRFKQFLDAARVPPRNHYIVCGLSGTGIKIVQTLHENGHEVVIIEPDTNNRFISNARKWGIPVINGDATFPTMLQSANLENCAALLAASGNDATNLEIALNAKGIKSTIPIIVRYADPDFARMAQQVFDFDAVLSPAELAAPAFAAAALGGRILGNGITADSLWVALATSISITHPFCCLKVRDAAILANFVPLYVETNNKTLHGWNLLNTNLCPGNVLYLTMPATKLHMLWRLTSVMSAIVLTIHFGLLVS